MNSPLARMPIGRLLPIAAPLLATALLWNAYLSLAESRRWEMHTYHVLQAISGAVQAVDDTVLRQQAYVLTGDEASLDGFHRTLGRLVPAVSAIAELTADNPRQGANLRTVQPMLDGLLGALARGTARVAAAAMEAGELRVQAAAVDAGVMRVREAFEVLAREERRLLLVRGEASSRAERFLALGGVLTAVCALASAYVALFRRRRTD